ncbi:hypothetical protein KBY66_01665 [Synechococcus sp. Tobar12-5m-g]|uniref:hypothetical protein n=1 Tax=Synechococcus sp. Tobar12-5m-g TaxID=2823742 RepID=UPI0020CC9236|nr:hypothetical protein [Synechococcus sp. Tobar12-5m-g]MCP9771344.1 hypothetical protein [Synechococcus sp. Tobar12-5m-g]MCP9872283.1 hypothetical protein [Synechococcus sp. Cruz CV-v-12]
MRGLPSDGCASGCGGCLVLIVAAALLVAGPAGWTLALVIVAVLLALGADRTKRRTSLLRHQSRPSLASGAHASKAEEAAAVTLRPDPDQELDQLLEEARRAIEGAE